MAWHCTGSTNAELIQNLYRNDLITSSLVRDAMMRTDRAHYAPANPYADSPQPIGHAATISAPHMHAHAIECLLPFLTKPAARVLDVGSGSGYLVHVFAGLVFGEGVGGGENEKGLVVGIEHIQALRDLGEGNMRKSVRGRGFLKGGRVRFVVGDGRRGLVCDGDGGEGWDAIHVGAAAVEVHDVLVEQLKCPGRLFIPVTNRSGDQHIWVIDKDVDGNVERKKLFGVRYVPLTDAPDE